MLKMALKGQVLDWMKYITLPIPINHQNMHWTAAAINFAQKRIESYDSMGRFDQKVCKVRLCPQSQNTVDS